ncbi:hypothetical protein ABW19_dt0201495 [Dactylella cylindrospora]|nr:hypothetical protein ABW19_dt0201495 [Dactylella cylindrospora]
MEVVGLVASIITLAEAAGNIGKAISRLRAFGDVPQQVYALKNEVSDLEVVLRQVGKALESHTLPANSDPETLEGVLVRTKTRLEELAKALERAAKASAGGRLYKVVGRSTIWWKWDTVFQKFQNEIREVKVALSLILGTSNA